MEEDNIPNGWPLGLGSMNSTIRLVTTLSPPPPPPPPPPPQLTRDPPLRPYSSIVRYRSSSVSSLSSSDLDTETTASFFPDQSVSLGWLFGMRDKGGNQQQRCVISIPHVEGSHVVTHNDSENNPRLCVPLLHLLGRLSRRGSISGN